MIALATQTANRKRCRLRVAFSILDIIAGVLPAAPSPSELIGVSMQAEVVQPEESDLIRKGIRSYGLFKKYRVSGQYRFGPNLVCLRHTVLETTKMTKFIISNFIISLTRELSSS